MSMISLDNAATSFPKPEEVRDIAATHAQKTR